MEIIISDTWILIIGILIGIFCTYIYIKISILENQIKTFPSPTDLAREIVKIKLPLSELPQEVQEQIKLEGDALKKLNKASLTSERPTYMG